MKKLFSLFLLLAMAVSAVNFAIAEEPIEITFWHQYTDNTVMDDIAAAYMADHPNVTIKVVSMKTQDMNTTLKMALTSGTGPDIFYYDAGPGYKGALADAGLLL